ncbi:riboflavin biosynthesis protein RibF [Granulicella arctica]|uniref:Riboflavin biosynthesis protein n=1 Tax=Granulicella arctica TaxID=940613 RepID=A0A7Y9PK49_9BACT|nr:riboflavin biosynthesis protein RibF [Granulicella arctica]NYF81347.1 riboflavin kinase/FMN adenylyltransferase [Granulicella arctica]
MQIFHSLNQLPPDFGPTIATIGNFDGVHRGHCWVIAEVIARAQALGLRSIAITFDPHPAHILRPQINLPLITPLAQKLDLLAATGIGATLVLPFDEAFSHTTARTFADTVLKQAVRAAEVHEGENFRFGYQAEAGIDSLELLGRELGFSVRVFAPQILRGQVVSSSRIRQRIAAGDVSQARVLLGRPFSIDSTPAPGRGYGTRFTVPTINLAPYANLLPANGVYVTTLRVGEETFEAVTNIGNRPTFGADSFTVESHLLNFHPIALDEATPLRLTFLKRLRPEIRWPNPEALKQQIGIDVARARRYFTLCNLSF